MNNKFERYRDEVEKRANRNIDTTIDMAFKKMRRRKHIRNTSMILSSFVAFFASYVVLLNTNYAVHAYVMNNDVLKVISQPFVFTNIFDEIDVQPYEDDRIKLDYLLNNFKEVTITKEVLMSDKYYDFSTPSAILGSNNSQYILEMDRSSEEVMSYPIRAIWRKTPTGQELVYSYEDLVYSHNILDYKGTLYVEDGPESNREAIADNYYLIPRNVYAIKNGKKTLIYSGEPSRNQKTFYIMNDVPYAAYAVSEGQTITWKAVNLETGSVSILGQSIDPMVGPVGVLSSGANKVLVQRLDFENPNTECDDNFGAILTVYQAGVQPKEYRGCNNKKYSIVSDRYILGFDFKETNINEGIYQLIDMEAGTRTIINDITEVYNRLSEEGVMLAVLKLESVAQPLEVTTYSETADFYSYLRIDDNPAEVLLVGNHESMELIIRDTSTNEFIRYIIGKKQ